MLLSVTHNRKTEFPEMLINCCLVMLKLRRFGGNLFGMQELLLINNNLGDSFLNCIVWMVNVLNTRLINLYNK